jgi:hypothetical protein
VLKLPPATVKFFAEAAEGKLPAAPLLSRADGAAWTKDAWKGPIRHAAAAAKMPAGATAYTLRHSTISDLVHGGLDLLAHVFIANILRLPKESGGPVGGDRV